MVKRALKLLREHEIIRRYITINSFDGALTIFGIIMASFVAGVENSSVIILPSVGATIAMGVSGMWGAYAAESAEVKQKTQELGRHMLKELKGTKMHKDSVKLAIIVAVVDGLSPMITSFVIILPFFLAKFNMIKISLAYYVSFSIVTLFLFGLGVFLGKIANENVFKNGLKMLGAGVIIGVLFYIMYIGGILA